MIDLRYFTSGEFGTWWPDMSVRLLVLLDVFRHEWGDEVMVSPHSRALGRRNGEDDTSQHNVDRWGEVRAGDVFAIGMIRHRHAERAVRIARSIGITGIGVYPDWTLGGKRCAGLHFDARREADPGNPATWGGVDNGSGKQVYVSLEDALARMPT